MTNREKNFPLNFNANYWSIEEAVPYIFFGDLTPNEKVSEEIVRYVSNEIEETSLIKQWDNEVYLIELLQPYLIRLLPEELVMDRKIYYPPVVWCRIAVQFWLEHGSRQQTFIAAMTQWIKSKNQSGQVFVFYDVKPDNIGGRTKGKMLLEVFLFGAIDIKDAENKNYRLNLAKTKEAVSQVKQPKSSKRSIQNSIGRNALAYVENLVKEAAESRSIRELHRKPDPNTQLYGYTGSRLDLYEALCALHPQCKTRYAKTVVIKAISQVAMCRKYWPKK